MWLWHTPRTRALLVTVAIALVAGLVTLVARVYVDLLWYREVGQEPVYWTALAWRILAPATVGVGTTCFVLANLAVVRRRTRGAAPPAKPAAVLLWRHGALLYPPAAIACGLISVRARPPETWTLLALWANRSPFGVDDPLFHRDVGFFVFSLPLYEEVARWLLQTVLMAGVAIVAAYAAAASLRAARAHLLGLCALVLLLMAWRLRLD